jgi:hypothetical protein
MSPGVYYCHRVSTQLQLNNNNNNGVNPRYPVLFFPENGRDCEKSDGGTVFHIIVNGKSKGRIQISYYPGYEILSEAEI